jgi:glycosyltransferase involved in cell wall biosynthesis
MTMTAPSSLDLLPADADASWTLVHDFVFAPGGAERVAVALAERALGGSPMAVLGGSHNALALAGFPSSTVRMLPPSLVQQRTYRQLAPLMPTLVSRVAPIEGNALVSSYAFAHYIRCTGKKVVYCHSPLRQIWSGAGMYSEVARFSERVGLRLTRDYLRRRDIAAAHDADVYIATNSLIRDRLVAYYGLKNVAVISPPLDTSMFYFDPAVEREDAYLWVGRIIEPYKRLELAIDAVRGTSRRLIVAGDGRDRARLEAKAPPNVEFIGWQDGDDLRALYQRIQAVVFTSEDDFGLVPVEAMACGTPTIAYRAGGAALSLVGGETGTFFEVQTVEELRRAMDISDGIAWDHAAISKAAAKYDSSSFEAQMHDLLSSL